MISGNKAVFLVLLFLIAAISYGLPDGVASVELVTNGGFETGNSSGWIAGRNCQIGSTAWAHSGQYVARLGNEYLGATISQEILVPEKSRATVRFWYALQKGTSIAFSLRETNGSIIKSWKFEEPYETWQQFSFELDPSYPSRSVVLVFDGKVWYDTVVPEYTTNERGEVILTYKKGMMPYYPFIDDVSVVAEVASYDIGVKISGLPSTLTTKISADGREEGSVGGEQNLTFHFTWGEEHVLKVEDYVYKSQGTRYVCKSNTFTCTYPSSRSEITFNYTAEHLLTVTSPYGTTEGSGWRDGGSVADFSVSPVEFPTEGVLNSLGVRTVFKGWDGPNVLNSSSPSARIKMDYPRTVTAVWTTDYSRAYMILGGMTMGIIGVSASALLVLRRKSKERKS